MQEKNWPAAGKKVDILYVDPPYSGGLALQILGGLSQCSYVTEDSLIVVETSLDQDFSAIGDMGLEIVREKCYKTQRHLFIRRQRKEA